MRGSRSPSKVTKRPASAWPPPSIRPPELLYFLTNDCSAAVRASVAMNQATPPRVHQHLARDPDERVRLVLARKLATLTPGLPEPEQARLREHAWNSLALLVQDTAQQVRQAVAELVSRHAGCAARADPAAGP